MACSHEGEYGEPTRCPGKPDSHPNLFDKLRAGHEVTDPRHPAGHVYSPAGELIQGDGIHHMGQSWVVKDIRDHERGRTVVVEPRKGFVGRTVISEAQFGTQGITMEDTDEQAFTFHPHQVIPRRG